jgi:rRNA maturation protein Nop10
VLFETIHVCGARAGEVGGLYVEDLDLRLDAEHVRIHSKGGTVLLDDRGYVALLTLYLQRTGYQGGPLLGDSINGTGGPLSCDAATTDGPATARPEPARFSPDRCGRAHRRLPAERCSEVDQNTPVRGQYCDPDLFIQSTLLHEE